MARTITAIAQPVQRHAHMLQIIGGQRAPSLAAQQADGGEAETLSGCGQRMQVIGVCATEADHALRASCGGLLEVGRKLEPFVAGHQRVDEIEAQTGKLDAGCLEPG